MKKIITCTILLFCAMMFLPGDVSAQCAMCGASVESSAEGAEMAAGLNKGILYLLVIPYLIFMTFAIVIVRSIRRNKSEMKTVLYQN